MTVDELRRVIADLPGEMPVLVSGYEGGFAEVAHAGTAELQELERTPGGEYLGRYVTPEQADEEMRGGPGSEWLYTVGGEPPQLVGNPFTALVIQRTGR